MTINVLLKQVANQGFRGLAAASAVAGFWLTPFAPASASEAIIVEQQVEDSVLIATRKAIEQAYDAPEGSLEPISQISEHEPSPADPPKPAGPPAETQTKAVTETKAGSDAGVVSVTDQPLARVASRPAAHVPGDMATAFLQEDQKIAAAPFKGIVAGQSTRKELVDLWGAPTETRKTPAGEVLTYAQEKFAAIEVLVEADKVELIKAQLDKQSQPERLAAKLRVDAFDSVSIKDDETGEEIGIAYPEKGLMLLLSTPSEGLTPIAPQFVTHLVLQAPDAEAFALRAETRPQQAYGKRLADLNQAVSIDKQDAYSLWLRSGVFLSTGQPIKAEADASLTLEQDKKNAAYRLRWCEALAGVGRFDDSVIETRKVIDAEGTPELVKAQALALMGRLASLGDAEIAEKAIGFHTTAIAVADKLATSKDVAERRAAKRLLIDSHLDIAIEVSRRSYDDKGEVVAQWIGRSSGIAEEMITNEQGSLELRLVIARQALEALANFKPSKDPAPWVKEATEAATAVLASTDDVLQKNQAHWELGQAYFHAMRVSHTRREADQAIAYGEQAIDHLASGAETGDVRPEAEQLVGRLYFHLGAAYAVHKQDHKSAVEWYDRAQPLLLSEQPKSELIVPRQLGEALVSMGVSYWDQAQQPKAVELTMKGAEIMDQAAQAGVLDRGAMAVPYGNLSTMHRKLGDNTQSAKYAQLAADARGTTAPSVANQRRPQRSASMQPQAQTRTAMRVPNEEASKSSSNSQSSSRSGKNSNRRSMLR
jgi:tetratricopeptide (TPR) repeat protein